MNALVKTGPTKGAQIIALDAPDLKDDEVLFTPSYAAICGTDHHLYHWDASGASFAKKFDIAFPVILGHEVSGIVRKVGSGVTRVKEGDRITLETHIPCLACYQCDIGNAHNCMNMGIYGLTYPGAFAEYAKAPERVVFKLPDTVSLKSGSLFEPAAVGIHGIDEAKIQAGDTVLVCGSGPIGLVAVQAAFASGAAKVIALDINDHRLRRAERYGAIGLNPSREKNLAERVREICPHTGGADVALELTGAAAVYEFLFDLIRLEGRLVTIGHSGAVSIDVTNGINLRGLSIKGIFGRKIWKNWWQLMRLLETNRIDIEGVITHEFPLAQFEKALTLQGDVGKVVFNNFEG